MFMTSSNVLNDAIEDDIKWKTITFRRAGPSPSIESKSDIVTIECGTISIDTADNILLPIISQRDGQDKLRPFMKLLLTEKASVLYGLVAGERVRRISESDLLSAIDGISAALSEGGAEEQMKQRPSVIKATVKDDRLVVINADIESRTPLNQLEAYRSEYLSEARYLRESLAGTNAGAGFNRRLVAIEKSLSEELTDVISLILADQARGLEIMLPAVSEMLIDTTAKDLSAFVAGLGLLSRQFPAWQNFVEEANQNVAVSCDNEEALQFAASVLSEQPDEIVAPEIKDAIRSTQEARIGVRDPILDFAFTRAIGNAYRAIGRYLLERAKSSAKQFNSTLEKEIGEVLAKSLLATTVGLSTHALSHLAAGMPAEFAWFAALAIMLTPKNAT